MATEQEPRIAADGVQEVPLTIARPLLTRLIEQALEDGLVTALTVRGRRRAYLVKPAVYESVVPGQQLQRDLVQRLYKLVEDPVLAERMEQLDPDLHLLLTTSGL
jgi:hypothetical protein